jgi:capsular polysaccharide biosynthesis protein
MDFGTLIRILVRRWYVVLPTLLITFLVAYTQVSSVKPEYTATGSILILQPAVDPAAPAPTTANQNPFAQLSAPLRTTAVVISGVLSDKAVHTQISQSGLSRDFTVTVDPDAPVTTITATAGSPKVAVATVNGLMARFTTELQARQTASGVPPTQQLQTQTLSAPTGAEKDSSNRSRAMGAFAVLGVIAALCAALTAENVAGRRRRRPPPTAAVEPIDFPLPPVLMERAATFALYDTRMERRWPPAEAPEPENGSAERVTKDAGLDLRTLSSRALGEDFGASSGSAGWAPSEPTNGGAPAGRTRYRHLGNNKAAAEESTTRPPEAPGR